MSATSSILSHASLEARTAFLDDVQKTAKQLPLVHAHNFFKHVTNIKHENLPQILDIEKRIKESKYFLLPGESSYVDMNCFELSTAMYLALKEIYPQSKPELMFVEDVRSGIHAMAFFTHNGNLWCADPNYLNFEEIKVSDGVIDLQRSKKKIQFSDIAHVDDETLVEKIDSLRKKEGIVDFIRRGQVIAELNHKLFSEVPMTRFAFMYLDKESGNPVYEIRGFEDASDRKALLRIQKFSHKKKSKATFITYDEHNWCNLKNATKESVHPVPSKPGSLVTSDVEVLRDFTHWIRHQKKEKGIVKFMTHPNVVTRFMDFRKKGLVYKGINPNKRVTFYDYLKRHFGSASNISLPQEFEWPKPGEKLDSWQEHNRQQSKESIAYFGILLNSLMTYQLLLYGQSVRRELDKYLK